jgi:hypothetical protein
LSDLAYKNLRRPGKLNKVIAIDYHIMPHFAEKIQSPFLDLVAFIKERKPTNVTLEVFEELDHTLRALFATLDEQERIKDLENSEQLKSRMIALFKDEKGPAPRLPYLGQITQHKCYAKKGCVFALGSTIYGSPNCKEHYVCGMHKQDSCLLCPKDVTAPAKEGRKDPLGENALSKTESPSSPGISVKTAEGEDWPKRLEPSKNSSSDEKAKNEIKKKPISQDISAVSEKKGKADTKPDNEKNFRAGNKSVDEEDKIEVNTRSLSVDDFNFERDEHVMDLRICKVRTKDGKLIWVIEDEYLELQLEHARRDTSSDNKLEEDLIDQESMLGQNIQIGK